MMRPGEICEAIYTLSEERLLTIVAAAECNTEVDGLALTLELMDENLGYVIKNRKHDMLAKLLREMVVEVEGSREFAPAERHHILEWFERQVKVR